MAGRRHARLSVSAAALLLALLLSALARVRAAAVQQPTWTDPTTGISYTKTWYVDRRPESTAPAGVRSCTVQLAKCAFHLAGGSKGRLCKKSYVPPSCVARPWARVSIAARAYYSRNVSLEGNTSDVAFTRIQLPPVTVGVWLKGVDVFTFIDLAPTIRQPLSSFDELPVGRESHNHFYIFQADVSKYAAVFNKQGELRMYADVPNATADFPYNIILTATYHQQTKAFLRSKTDADHIVPLSLWKSKALPRICVNSSSVELTQAVTFSSPANIKRAVVEVKAIYASHHHTVTGGTGYPYTAFPIQVLLDGVVAGIAWGASDDVLISDPAMLVYGFDVDISPFIGVITDGKQHTLAFLATEAFTQPTGYQCGWQVDGNLHLWLDRGVQRTTGQLLVAEISPFKNISSFRQDFQYDRYSGCVYEYQISVLYSLSANFKGVAQVSAGNVTTSIVITANRTIFFSYCDDYLTSQLQEDQSARVVVTRTASGTTPTTLVVSYAWGQDPYDTTYERDTYFFGDGHSFDFRSETGNTTLSEAWRTKLSGSYDVADFGQADCNTRYVYQYLGFHQENKCYRENYLSQDTYLYGYDGGYYQYSPAGYALTEITFKDSRTNDTSCTFYA